MTNYFWLFVFLIFLPIQVMSWALLFNMATKRYDSTNFEPTPIHKTILFSYFSLGKRFKKKKT